MVVAAYQARWRAFEDHEAELCQVIARVVEDGRRTGAFERKTPIEETCRSILLALEPLHNPLLWSRNLELMGEQALALSALLLRSLTFSPKK